MIRNIDSSKESSEKMKNVKIREYERRRADRIPANPVIVSNKPKKRPLNRC